MNIEFKLADKTDIKELIEVQNKGFHDDYVKYGECPSYNETEDAMLEHVENAITYKILKDGEMAGDIIIRKKDNHKYYIRVLCVIPKYQNFGIGQKALKFIEDTYNDASEWELITPALSFRNHHVYEKMGFVKVEEFNHLDILNMFRYRKQMKR